MSENGRTPPNNAEAEQALISYTFSLGRIPAGIDGLAPADFYRIPHEVVWAAVQSLAVQQKPCDAISVRDQLQRLGKLDERGGVTSAEFADLVVAPGIPDPGHTARIIQEHARRRRVIDALHGCLQRAYARDTDIEEVLQHAQEELGSIHEGASGLEAIREMYPRLDLAALLSTDRPVRQWLWWRLIPEGASVAMPAPAGSGKSLLVLALMIAVARGDRAFAGLRITNRQVFLIDMENTEDDLHERFRDLGVTAEEVAGLDKLIYLHLPKLPPLDTPQGGRELRLVLDAYGAEPGDVVVLDSTQRVIAGPENDSDTLRAYYRHTGILLKRAGLTVIRTDNTGKDTERGARGSSGKRDDVDLELFLIPEGPDKILIKPGKTRLPDIDPITLEKATDDDGQVVYDTAIDPFRAKISEAIAALDRHKVPLDTGMHKCWELLRPYGVNRDALRIAIKERRHLAGTNP